MKILKRVLLVILTLLVVGGIAGFFYFKNKFTSAPPNTLAISNTGKTFPFKWLESQINGKLEPHAAIMVPVRIPGVDQTFYMQFDMGAHSTVLYYNSVLSINEKYGEVFKLDTIEGKLKVIDAALTVGTVDVKSSAIGFRAMGNKIDWSDTAAIIKIGTVGSDFIEKHTLILDYKNQQITLANKVPEHLVAESDYLPFTFDGRKIFLTASLNSKPVSLWFDSGSSTFELIVEEKTFLQLAKPGAQKETFTMNSWGDKVTCHNIASSGTFTFGQTSVPLNFVTYIDWPNKLQALMLKGTSIGGKRSGMTGNKLFVDKVLVLNTPNLRYAVLE